MSAPTDAAARLRNHAEGSERLIAVSSADVLAVLDMIVDLRACYQEAKLDRQRDIELLQRAEAAERALAERDAALVALEVEPSK